MLGALGKYQLDARLGGGGMAEVFLASTRGAEGFSRRVAIKRVLPGFSDNPAFAGMFVSEATISSRLVHPNIVSVLDFDRDPEGRLFLVMELVEGKDLDALISTGVLPFPVVIYVIGEVLRGLGYAHDLPTGAEVRGIVHRDVSPHNVLLSWEGAVKVSDFGIAKARTASEATASILIKGKPAYMSPEQANGAPLDGRSDLFAVGIMLWELLVGRRLFVADDTRATLAAVLFGHIPRPRAVRGDVPKDLERVTMMLLEREPSARYATAEAALADLLQCADAPRAGREELIALLVERFPTQARVRTNVSRARLASRNPPPTGSVGQPLATPSVSSVMAAPTVGLRGRAKPGDLGRGARWMVGAALVVLAAAVTFAIVVATRDEAPTRAAPAPDADPVAGFPMGSTAGSATGSSGPVVSPAPPQLPPPVADATPAVPGPGAGSSVPPPGSVEARQKDARAARDGQAVSKKYGQLEVRAFPVRTVYVDGKHLGDTSVKTKLPVGRHTLRLVNRAAKLDETIAIEIRENKVTEIDRTTTP